MSGVVATAALLCAISAAARDPRAQLEAVRARKAAEEAHAQALRRREGSILSALDEVEQRWARADSSARIAAAEHTRAVARLAAVRAVEADARARLEAARRALVDRLRVRARMRDDAGPRLLLASTSFPDLVKRRYLWSRIAGRDRALMQDAQRALAACEQTRVAKERESRDVERLAADARQTRMSAAARRDEHRALLASIRAERSAHERAAAEAAEQQARLAEFVEALPPPVADPGGRGFAALRGKLPLPVRGTVAVAFGPVVNPRFHTVTVQKGLDLRAAPGATVHAVAAGRVVHAGWFKGYGNLVIVDHGEGYHTLVAYLASLGTATGEEVQEGTALGTVGDDDSPRGPYLYFELREKGRPVDPRAWVRSVPGTP